MSRDVDLDRLTRRIETLTGELADCRTHCSQLEARCDAMAAEEAALKDDADAKSRFLAVISHEVRTPLSGIMGFADLLMDMATDEDQSAYLKMMKQSADSLLALVNNILDLSKIEAGRMTVDHIPFDARVLVEDIADSMALQAEQKGLEMVCHIHQDLPPFLIGDPQSLRQVMVNLIGNAVKFTDAGEILLEVEPVDDGDAASSARVTLEFSVTDTGIGIEADKQALIFQRFHQAGRSTRRSYGGTGLGLAISKQLIELMGGRIGVTSQPGKGARFWFRLPFDIHDEPGSKRKLIPGDIKGLRVLIADGNTTYQRILGNMLTAMKCRPACAGDAHAAMEKLLDAAGSGDPYQVLLLDLALPGMDGAQLAREIQREPLLSGLRPVVLTGITRRQQAQEMKSLGCMGYLTKPIRQSLLQDALAAVMGVSAPDVRDESVPMITRHSVRETKYKNIRILLAEDSEVGRQVMARILKNAGYSVTPVRNGEKAVRAFEKNRFDLVLMDVQMPVMDGLEAARRIRDLEARQSDGHNPVPIVAMTGNAMPGDMASSEEAGMTTHIIKPVQKTALLDLIQQLTETATAKTETPLTGTVSAPASSTGSNRPIDVAEALDMATGDPHFLEHLVSTFLSSIDDQIESIMTAADKRQWDEVVYLSHRIKGTASNLSMHAVASAARRLEHAAASASDDNLALLVEVLAMTISDLKAFVERPGWLSPP